MKLTIAPAIRKEDPAQANRAKALSRLSRPKREILRLEFRVR
jgi:hypothetical protein